MDRMKTIMKNKWVADTLQTIKKHRIPWLVILLAALIGTAAILGTDGAARAVLLSSADYYDAQNYRHVQVTADHLLSPEDLEVIRDTEGVEDAEPVWQTKALTGEGEDAEEIAVLSLTEHISLASAAEGRLPGDVTECAAEKELCEKHGWKVGDVIRLTDENGGIPEHLRGFEFTLAGIAVHPDHTVYGASETGYVLVTPGAFDQDALENCAMKAEILMEEDAADRFSKEHDAAAADLCLRLEELAPERIALRDAAVREKALKDIDAGRAELDEAWKALETSRGELDAKWKEQEAAERELDTQKSKLPGTLKKLNSEKVTLDAVKKQLDEDRKALDEAAKTLEEPKKKLEESRKQLDAEKKKLDEEKAQLDETADELAQNKKKLASDFASLEKEKAAIRSAIRQVIENAYGGGTGDLISWAAKDEPDINEEDVSAEEIRITASYQAGISKSWSQVIEGFVYSSAIPDEVLVQIYKNMKDDPHAEPDLKEVREFLSAQAIGNSEDVGDRYGDLQPACAEWTAAHKEYLKARSSYKKAQSGYQEKLEAYKAEEKTYTDAEKEYKTALEAAEAEEAKYKAAEEAWQKDVTAYEKARTQYEQEAKAAEDSQKALDESRAALEQAEEKYTQDKADCDEGEKKLEAARTALQEMKQGTWEIRDEAQNAGLVKTKHANSLQKGLAVVSVLVFVTGLVLAVYIIISRMMLAERSELKNTKVTLEQKQEIWISYLIFAVSAVLIGMILGIILARFVLEPLILSGYAAGRTFGMDRRSLRGWLVILVLIGGIMLAATVTSIACLRPLHKQKTASAGKTGKTEENEQTRS